MIYNVQAHRLAFSTSFFLSLSCNDSLLPRFPTGHRSCLVWLIWVPNVSFIGLLFILVIPRFASLSAMNDILFFSIRINEDITWFMCFLFETKSYVCWIGLDLTWSWEFLQFKNSLTAESINRHKYNNLYLFHFRPTMQNSIWTAFLLLCAPSLTSCVSGCLLILILISPLMSREDKTHFLTRQRIYKEYILLCRALHKYLLTWHVTLS